MRKVAIENGAEPIALARLHRFAAAMFARLVATPLLGRMDALLRLPEAGAGQFAGLLDLWDCGEGAELLAHELAIDPVHRLPHLAGSPAAARRGDAQAKAGELRIPVFDPARGGFVPLPEVADGEPFVLPPAVAPLVAPQTA